MPLKLPSETTFHAVESTIKTYRKYAQQQISAAIPDITLDQTLALIYLYKYPNLNQNALADLLFKDSASLTRMIKTMIKHEFLQREINPDDLRRYNYVLTEKGVIVIQTLPRIISENRTVALNGISESDQKRLKLVLNKIVKNCLKHTK